MSDNKTKAVEKYFSDMWQIRQSGHATNERSFYAPFRSLINGVAESLKLKVFCLLEPRNQGAGMPDGMLMSKKQAKNLGMTEPIPGISPDYGVIEIKPTGKSVLEIAESEQVAKYWNRYRKVLVTNYWDFALVDDLNGKPNVVDKFQISESEAMFWAMAAHPKKSAEAVAGQLVEFLWRSLIHTPRIVAPEDLAKYMASFARDALAIVEKADIEDIKAIREAIEHTLGVDFSGDKGEHLFKSLFVQTLFYGIFSAWVVWHSDNPVITKNASFDWQKSHMYLKIPVLRILYHQLSEHGTLEKLKLLDILTNVGNVINRVDRAQFFQKFRAGEAIQYFYEPFLQAYDSELRKEYGVWYTPPEIVKYMVERVHRVLQTELDRPDGLASDDVYILDPCCGTGAYLVEVVDKIAETLESKKSERALLGEKLKRAALTRIFGFEIMPAPFVIAHMQMNLALSAHQARLNPKKDERAGIYLTNSLIGWDPPKGKPTQTSFPVLDAEREAAAKVKRDEPILVVIGNPPYNAFAGVAPEEEHGLVEVYKGDPMQGKTDMFGGATAPSEKKRKYLLNMPESEGGWGIKKFNLDDLYIRFFRIAERRVAEKTGKGIVCFISNFSFLGDSSFVIMRENLLNNFDKIWIDCMNGDSRETGKRTPDGKPDPSVFSTKSNTAGIRLGTSVSLFVKRGQRKRKSEQPRQSSADIKFRHFWGVNKRQDLLKTLKAKSPVDFDSKYQVANPSKGNRYSFKPLEIPAKYLKWPRVTDICHAVYNGPVERRGMSLIKHIDQVNEFNKLKEYLDPSVSDLEMQQVEPLFVRSSGEFNAAKTRDSLKGQVKFRMNAISQYIFKPFDQRLAYLDAKIQPLFSRPSPELLELAGIDGNSFFVTRDSADKDPEGAPAFFSGVICDYSCLSGPARIVPLLKFCSSNGGVAPNLSVKALDYLRMIGFKLADVGNKAAQQVWLHALAIAYSPCYLAENSDGIKQEWPRIPLPGNAKLLGASSILGEAIAVRLDAFSKAAFGVTHEEAAMFGAIADFARKKSGEGISEADGLFELTAGWGYKSRGRDETEIVMPGTGRIEKREYSGDELAVIEAAGVRFGNLKLPQMVELLGEQTCDVHLNEYAFWKNIPLRVWEYYIGGFQVIKKWLSYRELGVLGRSLTFDEVQYVSEVARRLAYLRLLEPKLDANYKAVKENAFDWKQVSG